MPGRSIFWSLTDGSESMEGMWVTRDYFRVTGLQPMMGRTFLESETGPKPAPVIILGYELWQRKFNGDPTHHRQDHPHQPLRTRLPR